MKNLILLSTLILLVVILAGCKNSQTNLNQISTFPQSEQQSQPNINQQTGTQPSSANDECDIVPGQEPIDKVIFESEKEEYDCEKNPKCEWRYLGGMINAHYACCPKDLLSVNLSDSPSFSRCLMKID